MLPNKLKAGGQEFTIEYKDYVAPGKRGLVNYGQTRIDVRSDRDLQTQAETIIHEAFHIAEAKSNLKLEEKVIQTFGRVLFAVLRDNPDLFDQDVIKICGFDYKVLRVDVVDKDSEDDLASWVKHCEFRLASDLSNENQQLHLVYMVLDAIESVLDTEIGQDVKHRLGDWLHAILKDNPQIWPHRVLDQPPDCEGINGRIMLKNLPPATLADMRELCTEKPPCQMSWFKCDKGWFGVPERNRYLAIEAVCRLGDDMDTLARDGISLFDIMTWAVQNGIPYEISTVEPRRKVV